MTSLSPGSDGWNVFDPERFFRDGMKDSLGKQGPLNMILAGRTGVGKSTLINAIFGEQLAETGVGAPVTALMYRHKRPGIPITIYDTPGIELGQNADRVLRDYLAEIKKNAADPQNRIHFALYCVRASDRRFEEFEATIIRKLAQELPVVLVLTQVLDRNEPETRQFIDYLTGLDLPVLHGRVFPTLAASFTIAGITLPQSGLVELVNAIYAKLPLAAAQTLASYQQVSLDLKIDEAHKVVLASCAGAAAIAATPIPLLDAIPLSVLQLGMLGRITTVMGLRIDPKSVATALAGIMGVATAARTVAGFFKVFPGVGSAINASIAVGVTKSLGSLYISACTEILHRQIAGEVIAESDITAELIKSFRRLRTTKVIEPAAGPDVDQRAGSDVDPQAGSGAGPGVDPAAGPDIAQPGGEAGGQAGAQPGGQAGGQAARP